MKRLELHIARRYLFARKSHNAINIISAISALGVAVATMAMVVTLSVFNGFRDLVADLFTSFDPQLQVTPVTGNLLSEPKRIVNLLKADPDVQAVTPVMQDQAMIVMPGGQQQVVTIKGVADNWEEQTDIQSILYPALNRPLTLHADVLEYGVLGIQLAARLGLSIDFHDPLAVYAPKPGARVNMTNPMLSFNQDELLSPGQVFAVRQSKYDANYIITSLGFAQRLFSREGELSHLEVRLTHPDRWGKVQRRLSKQLGSDYQIKNRWQQQEDVFRIMRIEKFLAYLFLSFILLIASFNIIGSLSMLMIDKQQNVVTLRNLGATTDTITRIFTWEGLLISLSGALLGAALGVLACWLQQEYGLVPMGSGQGDFIVESYPVSVRGWDVAIVLITVIVTNIAAVWWPVRRMAKRLV